MKSNEELRGFVFKVRTILENHKEELDPVLYQCFPRGCCGNISSVLGRLLKENGFGVFEYVYGRSEVFNIDSHAWLEKEAIVCDITADQFEELLRPKVYVDESDSFYKSFSIGCKKKYYQTYDSMWHDSCYNLVKKYS